MSTAGGLKAIKAQIRVRTLIQRNAVKCRRNRSWRLGAALSLADK